MSAFLVYLKLELKRACRILPYFIAGAVVLVILLGMIALSASKVLYGDSVAGRFEVGVVLPKEDAVAKMAISMLSSMDSVNSICDFLYLEEQEGQEKLKAGDIQALMLVPQGLVEGIMNGTNTPATILLPANAGVETAVFKELTEAGAKNLSVAQAAIYGADEFFQIHGMVDQIADLEAALNKLYLGYSLPRADYFWKLKVSAAGDISVAQYYGVSAVTLLLLLSGIALSVLFTSEKRILRQKLKLIGIGRWQIILAKVLTTALLLTVLFGLLSIVFISCKVMEFSWYLLPLAVVVNLTVAAMIVFAYEVTKSQLAGVMCIFWGAIGMLFLAGGFIPAVFLPENMQHLSKVMPVTAVMAGLKQAVAADSRLVVLVPLLFWSLGFYVAAVAAGREHE